MPWHPYDRTSKWLIDHHGDSLLRVAGITDIVSWRAAQAEVVQPGQLPDGLLEVQLAREPDALDFLLEIGTYPEPRLGEQAYRDMLLVLLDRRRLPELVVIVLRPRGQVITPHEIRLSSKLGFSHCQMSWRVVKMWEQTASELLEMNDVGLLPWVPLTQFQEAPEAIVTECRRRIDDQASADERANLLAVSQVLVGLRYNDTRLLTILGGRQIMIESPVLQDLIAKTTAKVKQDDIVMVLEERFRTDLSHWVSELRNIVDDRRLVELTRYAAVCPDIDSFQKRLRSWAPAS